MSIRPHPTKNRDLPTPRHWYIVTYPNGRKGKQVSDPFEGSEAEARAVESAVRKAQRKTPLRTGALLEQCIPDFIASYKVERMPRSVDSAQTRIVHLLKHFGKYPLTAITASMVENYKRGRQAEGVKPITVNKELNILSVILKWAKTENMIGPFDPVKLFPGKMVKSPIPIMPPGDELEAVVMEVDPKVRGVAMLMFYAGLRRNEAHRLRAEDVLLKRGLLIIEGKGGKQRVVPVNNPLLIAELAQKIDEVGSGYLWVNPTTKRPYKSIIDAIKGAARRVGADGRWYNHLLRHGFGTTATESGIDLRSVQGLMGHSTSKTTEIYTHLAATHLIREMKRFKAVQDEG